MLPLSMWIASVKWQPWQWVGFLLMRQGHGAVQQQPMMRVPRNSQVLAAVAVLDRESAADACSRGPLAQAPRNRERNRTTTSFSELDMEISDKTRDDRSTLRRETPERPAC